jgi:hypothetical protein
MEIEPTSKTLQFLKTHKKLHHVSHHHHQKPLNFDYTLSFVDLYKMEIMLEEAILFVN